MGIFGASTTTPSLTEKSLTDQKGKVFIVTGSTAGVGKELAEILFAHNAKVYLAARSKDKADGVIAALKSKYPGSTGQLVFLPLNLDDLASIKASAQTFLDQEERLDVLWNNAGVMLPPTGSKNKQGHELQLGVNCLAPFLFTQFLVPCLKKTAASSPQESVRVVWLASEAVERYSPQGGVEMDNLDYHKSRSDWQIYGASKAGNFLYAKEFAKRHPQSGVINVSCNPGNLKSDLWKNVPRWQMWAINLILKDVIYGAYTEMYAGLSADIREEHDGVFVEPWGKMGRTREDVESSGKSKGEGGSGIAAQFWDWSEQQVKPFLPGDNSSLISALGGHKSGVWDIIVNDNNQGGPMSGSKHRSTSYR